jgi:hypothetical protein
MDAATYLTTADKSPSELEQRRRDIVHSLTHDFKGYDDPDVPLDLLRELAFITQTLRRKNSGPPKVKRVNAKPTTTLDDLLV